jgi:hypothetical protein
VRFGTRIIKLESEIVSKVLSDRTFRPSNRDEFQNHRLELEELREKVKHLLYPPSYLPDGKNPQRPTSSN